MPWTLRDVDIDADVGGPNMEHGAGCEARLCDELPIEVQVRQSQFRNFLFGSQPQIESLYIRPGCFSIYWKNTGSPHRH